MSEIITTLESAIIGITTETISVVNAEKLGFDIGNYLQIDDEIFQIRQNVIENSLYVKRGLFGTIRSSHDEGAIVRRIDKPTSYLPPDTQNGSINPTPPTIVSFNNSEYEIARTYGTVSDPQDVDNLSVGKLAIIGSQDGPSNFVSVDVANDIASNISKNVTTQDTIEEYTSFYSRPNLWRSGGSYDVCQFDKAYHFRVLPFQQDPIGIATTVVTGIATFYGSEKTRVYFDDLTDVELKQFLVEPTYFPDTIENRARIIGIGSTYIDVNVEHNFVGIATTASIQIVGIKTSDINTEFGYYFNGEDVNFNLIDHSYGFYYGSSTGNGLSTCVQPTHRRWGIFIETSPWNPCDPESECEGESVVDIDQTWNFFEDLTLFGDHRSIGFSTENNSVNPEPLVQILRPKHNKRGLYVKDNVGIGTSIDRRVQLYVDNSDNPCPDKTHALYVVGDSTFESKVGIGTSIPNTNLHVVGDSLITGISTFGLKNTSSPSANSQMSFELTDNATLTIRVKGTDGVVRTGIVTLS